MNDQMASPTPASILNAGQDWLTLPFVLIGLGVIAALLVLWWGARLSARRKQGRAELEERGDVHYAGRQAARSESVPAPVPVTPPVTSPPPPLSDVELPASPAAADPVPEAAPLADEPIAAAAPMDASPASIAASSGGVPGSSNDTDDFTRMKGVGPKLAERLNALGITRFSQVASLSPEEATALDAQLGNFQGRLQRDRWIEQARFLAADDTAGYEAQFGRL